MLFSVLLMGFLAISAQDAGITMDSGIIMDSGAVAPSCEAYCDGETLMYCDQNEVVAGGINCGDMDASCARLNDEWGFDCLLKEGAECSYGYAYGASRCDSSLNLNCVDGVCSTEEKLEEEDEILVPESIRGTSYQENEEKSLFDSCESCQNSGDSNTVFSMFFCALGLRRFRKKRI